MVMIQTPQKKWYYHTRRYFDLDSTFLERYGRQMNVKKRCVSMLLPRVFLTLSSYKWFVL